MDIEWRSVSDLRPYPQNAKKHDERQIRNVATSIERFGWRQPLVIDKNDVVVIGHCRLLAAKELGLDKVPVTVADDLTEEEIRELRIVDNKTNESPWDFELLQEDAKQLTFEGFDFDSLQTWDELQESAEIEKSEAENDDKSGNLAREYLVPPFSVIYANKPDWLARKRAWVKKGLRSEIGRGGDLLSIHGAIQRQTSYTGGNAPKRSRTTQD